ncbi:hypothetical protein [Halorussus halobius]|uniref:hypothetical protein n=1 Tax=Halorussus halobius TaxID=1710537 RepID=UPI001092CB7D|nr:hypothetical protein [Halorussus halobius]
MLTTESYRLDDALDDITAAIDALDTRLADLQSSIDDEDSEGGGESGDEVRDLVEQLEARRDRLTFQQHGLQWQRDEEDWGGDTELVLGALTAGEEAIKNRAVPERAGRDERVLWLLAAATIKAPYADNRARDDRLTESVVEANFQGLAGTGIHPGFRQWLEAQVNSLGVPSESGNRSGTSSPATGSSGTSQSERDSTTSSSSDSPTA